MHASHSRLDDPVKFHRLIEAFKFAYARRMKMSDPAYHNMTEVSTLLI